MAGALGMLPPQVWRVQASDEKWSFSVVVMQAEEESVQA